MAGEHRDQPQFFPVPPPMRLRWVHGVCLMLATTAAAADVVSSGAWTQMIDATDLTAGAGSDLVSQYESAVGTLTLDVANTGGASWKITAHAANGTWDPNLILYVRRTSDGSGVGSITGGVTYIPLGALDTDIFTGAGDRSNVAVQIKVSGMSKSIAPNTYGSGVVFTIVLL